MASADLFNLTQSNQKQFSDNNTMELSLRDLKLFGGLDGINGINNSHEEGVDEILAADTAASDTSFTSKSVNDAFNNDLLNATEMVASATGSSECSVSETSCDVNNVLITDDSTIAPNTSASIMMGSDESGVLMDSSVAKCEEPTSDSFESQLTPNIQLNGARNAEGEGDGSGQSEDSSRSGSIGFGSSLSSSAANGTILLNTGPVGGNIGGGLIQDLSDCALEDPNSLNNDDEPECKICKSVLEVPRVLSCLHVVCEACLNTLLMQETGETRNCTVACPVCKQDTTIDSRGAAGLHLDYTVTNTVDLNNVEPHALACTSCKSKEQAMSRCNDCANFLCACCDNAHKYMRCFENHAVVLLSKLRDSNEKIVIHKPLFCNVHPSELLKFYCFSCQTVACNDCLVAVHKGVDHRCDLIAEAETGVRSDLQNMVDNARAKIVHCDSAAGNLSNTLTELQQQHDNARDMIETTYERCSVILESCREGSLRELQRIHAERELYIMDALNCVEKSVEKIKTTCRFAQKILTDGNGVELLSLQNVINRQVHQVMHIEPKVERNVEFAFEGKVERFELLAKDAFGRFQSDGAALTTNAKSTDTAGLAAGNISKERTSAPTLAGMLPMLSKSSGPVAAGLCVKSVGPNRPYDNPQSTFTASHTASSPISIPVSMQSAFDGDILTSNYFMSNGGSGGGGGAGAGNGDDLSQMQQLQHVQLSHQQTTHQLLPNVDMIKRESQQIGCNSLIASSAVSVQSAICNGTSLANVMSNVNSNNLSTALVNSSLGGIGSVGNALNNGLNGASGGQLTPPINNISGLSSIAEYNLHRLANLVESNQVGVNSIVEHHQQHHHQHHQLHNLEENVIATLGSGSVNGNNVNNVPGGVGSSSFTLTDLINGDQRAFSQNLHALAKLNMNSVAGVGHLSSNVLNRGTSPSGVGSIVDTGSLLNDFIGMPGNTSPIGTISSSLGDDMGAGSAGALSNLTAAMNLAGRTKATPMQIRCKFGSLGASKAQFNSPHGFCLGVEEEIIVADTNNHRIQVFEKIGTFKFQFGVPGKEEGQLWYPRKVAVMRTSGKFVVCDRGNERSRMQIFTKNGHFIKKIAIRYIDIVAGLAVTNQGHIVAVDSVSPTVFIIAEDGNLVHWFDCSDYMREPSDIAISGSDFYVCDFKGHNVAVFSENGTFLHRIGDEKITCFPNGIDISDAGDILIGDSHGNRFHVACFSREGVLQSEFECPYVKVSRCCGLKITSEGYVVTLAKNNHHVLVLNTLYIH